MTVDLCLFVLGYCVLFFVYSLDFLGNMRISISTLQQLAEVARD